MALTPQRILRLSIAHYKNPSVSDEDFHHWATHEHCVRAAGIHKRHGVEKYGMVFNLPAARKELARIDKIVGGNWVIDDHDVIVEFYLQDTEGLIGILNDPDFAALQAAEGPWVDAGRGNIGASLGWVETYLENSEPVNAADGKPTYGELDIEALVTKRVKKM
ncbi:hypothetical protein GGS21DRAFT_496428 [Xylaria nigripes]|nr:hypothetical protein GGS21DRAFT_496428 [Xylaria nigripes]